MAWPVSRSDDAEDRAGRQQAQGEGQKIWPRICSGRAPNAMRTPISRRRWATA